MGAGKSTVGAALARSCGVDLCDTDEEIVDRSGRSVPAIFQEDGEAGFRTLEAEVVADVVATHSGVVSLGGGAVMTPAVREALVGHTVVYLRIGAEAGFARVAHSDRPLLAAPNPAERYAEVLADREETYRAVASLVVDADRDPQVVVDDILARLASRTESEQE
nr:shikimate kinase [Gordonia phthalatica]